MASFLDSVDDLLADYEDYSTTTGDAQQQATTPLKDTQEAASQAKRETSFSVFCPAAFSDFLLKPELIRAIVGCGFEKPSEVQQACIPVATHGIDVLCQAKSGMGKTAVYVLSTLQQIEPREGVVSVLVLCPTRELAIQVKNTFDTFSKCLPNIKTQAFFGGTPMNRDTEILGDKLRCPDIVVGTVGRTLSLVREKHLDLHGLKHLVIDECDFMLSQYDSRQDIHEIESATSRDKQVMMFSATLPVELRAVCKQFMQSPLEIYLDNQELTLHGLQQFHVTVADQDKIRLLFKLLDAITFNQVCIFVRTVEHAHTLDRLLNLFNFPSICIHSQMSQGERVARYQVFKNFEKRMMVATDLFGRGIDIERVNVVINFDMPDTCARYLHRAGRAGRFGTKGVCISFLTDRMDEQIMELVKSRFQVDAQPLTEGVDINSYLT
ncbi:hypothetical protein MBANPS3_004348 [Mucor bainieri]